MNGSECVGTTSISPIKEALPQTPENVRTGEVLVQLNLLGDNLNSLDHEIGVLFSRLEVVLSNSPPSEEPVLECGDPVAPLAMAIVEVRKQAMRMVDRVRDLVTRLEV